jgi:hypothetical protein
MWLSGRNKSECKSCRLLKISELVRQDNLSARREVSGFKKPPLPLDIVVHKM